jgi:hypothetical protein
MPKNKLQKRREALARQRDHVIRVAIPNWCRAFTASMGYDIEDKSLASARLIASAYAACCDRHGNYLDWRYYTSLDALGVSLEADPLNYALKHKLKSIDELQNTTAWPEGRSLYEHAYGVIIA